MAMIIVNLLKRWQIRQTDRALFLLQEQWRTLIQSLKDELKQNHWVYEHELLYQKYQDLLRTLSCCQPTLNEELMTMDQLIADEVNQVIISIRDEDAPCHMNRIIQQMHHINALIERRNGTDTESSIYQQIVHGHKGV